MALWLCRAGKQGEYETKFIEDKRIYCTRSNLDWDMSKITDRVQFRLELNKTYAGERMNTVRAWFGQIWLFAHGIKTGDMVVVPSKVKPVVHIAEVKSDYVFDSSADEPYKHYHQVKWLKEIPRAAFDPDLLYTLDAALTICGITRNDAEHRVLDMLKNPLPGAVPAFARDDSGLDAEDMDSEIDIDIEDKALEEIRYALITKYKGHGMADIVAAILEAKGFTTHVSPPGPDKGVDILASKGSLGFDPPRICVQVKSENTPLDRKTHDQLIGTMSNHKAEYGMLVSWSGFKRSITKEEASHFFKIRLWTHKEIVQEFLKHYEDLPEGIREAIPLKRVWIIDK